MSEITKSSLMRDLEKMGIDPQGTLLVHSSMKQIGEVEGGADAVLDALSAYMADGLLVLPTHTWAYINKDGAVFSGQDSPSCVGILTELFRKRSGVRRSQHPTHSVAALGKDAEAFVSGDERFDTPCARGSVCGKLLDRRATILLIGVDLTKNTFFHGVEEWMNVPARLADKPTRLLTVLPDGTMRDTPVHGHIPPSWENYGKVEGVLEAGGALRKGMFGQAETRLCDTVKSTLLLNRMLTVTPDLFSDDVPVNVERYPGLFD